MSNSPRWLAEKRDSLIANGWRVVPVQENGNPYRYGNGETYPADHSAWKKARTDVLAVALDGALLVDYDGNKPGTVSEAELVALIGEPLGVPHQIRAADNSKHYLFRPSEDVDQSTLKNSQDGKLAKGVDVKRGNQLCYLKADKTLPHGGTFPPLEALSVAPASLINLLKKPENVRTTFAEAKTTDRTSRGGRKALAEDCRSIAEAVETTRNDTLNTKALGIFQLVAGGEIAESDAENALEEAAAAAGLMDGDELNKTRGTIASAKRDGMNQPRTLSKPCLPSDFDVLPPKTAELARDGKAAFLYALPGMDYPPFAQWDGMLGDWRDELRSKIAEATDTDLRLVPPVVRPKLNVKDKIVGYIPANHADNFMWVTYREGLLLARNRMTWEVELFDSATQKPYAESESETESRMIGAISQYGLPENLVKHMEAVAMKCSYHPVARLLHGKKWDGVERVQRVFDCVPVAPGDVAMRDALLTADAVGSIAALEDGKVSMKIVPTLFGGNDLFKTAYLRCLGDITPGAFQEGADVLPGNENSERKFITCWRAEIGEADKLTAREGAAVFKAFVPMDSDRFRVQYAKTFTRKPRQMTACATVNSECFIKDPSTASRLPTIRLTGAIDIEQVNELLGWKMVKGAPTLVNRDKLIQYWLEVSHWRNELGKTHTLDKDTLAKMKVDNSQHIDKGSYYDAICDALYAESTIAGTFGIGSRGEWFSPSEMCLAIRANVTAVKSIGNALTELAREGVLEKKRSNKSTRYRLKDAPPEPGEPDLSVEQ